MGTRGGGTTWAEKNSSTSAIFFIRKQIKEIKKLNLNNCLEVQAERS